MPKKPVLDESEKNLFRDMMRGVKPLSTGKILPDITQLRKPKKPVYIEINTNPLELFEDHNALPVSAEDILFFHRGGLQHKILRNLKAGKYNVEAILDLHGQRVFEAQESLNDFLTMAQDRHLKCVMIIHGKGRGEGKPVLKNKINQWLRQIDFVLAFSSATVHAGRSGALYVLLRAPKRS